MNQCADLDSDLRAAVEKLRSDAVRAFQNIENLFLIEEWCCLAHNLRSHDASRLWVQPRKISSFIKKCLQSDSLPAMQREAPPEVEEATQAGLEGNSICYHRNKNNKSHDSKVETQAMQT